jgi:flagellar motor switch protein FliM
MINERFIRTFRLGLVEMLRTSPKVNPNQVEICSLWRLPQKFESPFVCQRGSHESFAWQLDCGD